VIFFAAVLLGPSPEDGTERARRAREVAAGLGSFAGWLAVSDPWSDLDLSRFGFDRDQPQTWMSRPPGPVSPGLPVAGGFEMVKVTDEPALAEFEAAHNEGFGAKPTIPGTYYGRALLDDPRMHVFLVRDAHGMGTAVGTAMAYVSDEVAGVYSVSVIPRFRGRGIGWALTREAVQSGPDRRAVLQPSAEGLGLYGRMGFEAFADFAVWVRPER
jgi:GNAT superfamily N-acetyltransferase